MLMALLLKWYTVQCATDYKRFEMVMLQIAFNTIDFTRLYDLYMTNFECRKNITFYVISWLVRLCKFHSCFNLEHVYGYYLGSFSHCVDSA